MRTIKLLSFVLIFATFITACKKEEKNKEQETIQTLGSVQFNLQSEALTAKGINADNLNAVIITIRKTNGEIVHNMKTIKLLKFNESYITEPIALNIGNYELVDYMVVNANNEIVFVTPKKNSEMAHLVTKPLEIPFIISKDIVTKLTPEVLKVEGTSAINFGYVTFSFNEIKYFDFLTGVFVYDNTIQNYKLTDAKLEVKIEVTTIIHSQNIPALTTKVYVLDKNNNYTLTVTKLGYKKYVKTFSRNDLFAYNNNPLVICLQKDDSTLFAGLKGFYPFEMNANDHSGNNYHGTQVGNTHFVNGIIGKARKFVKDSAQHVFEYVNIPCPINGNEYTVSFWTKLTNNADHNTFLILNNTGSWYSSALWIYTSGGKIAVLQNAQDLRTSEYLPNFNYSQNFLNSPVLSANKDYYITVTFKNKTLSIYLNGNITNTYTNVSNIPAINENIKIGVCPTPNSYYGYGYQLNGNMDELRIYNRALTSNEIQTLYALRSK